MFRLSPMTQAALLPVFALALIVVSCTGAATVVGAEAPLAAGGADQEAYRQIHRLLARDGDRLGYDDLSKIAGALSAAQRPIPRVHDLLAGMIAQRNPNPRVDRMILIYAARAIGKSTREIPRAGELFHAILDQPHRLNEWVMAFVAEGIEHYPFNLPRGDQLMDRVQAQVVTIRKQADTPGEYFGSHFLPPPRTAVVQRYLAAIQPRRLREQERRRYYFLIQSRVPEADIAASLSHLQSSRGTGNAPSCPLVMKCLVQMMDRLPLP